MNDRRPSKEAWPESPSLSRIVGRQGAKAWPCRRRKRSPTCLSVLPLRSVQDRWSLRRLDFARSSRPSAKRLPLHLTARWTVDGMRSTISPPTAHSRPTRPSSSGATSMFGLCLSTSAPTVALAPAKVALSLQRIRGRLGADDTTTRRGRGSEEFGPLETMPQHQPGTDPPSSPRKPPTRHDATLDQILLAGTWSRTIARLGLT